MSTVRRTLDLDPETDARLSALAAERGEDPARIVADAMVLLDSIVDIEGPDAEEDVQRLRAFERTGLAVSSADVDAWVDSWGTANELPRPRPRKRL
jgi:predicted transcriptional regulator